MKALRSPLANQLLADPVARDRLRLFIGSAFDAGRASVDSTVRVEQDGRTVVYQPVVVAKAA